MPGFQALIISSIAFLQSLGFTNCSPQFDKYEGFYPFKYDGNNFVLGSIRPLGYMWNYQMNNYPEIHYWSSERSGKNNIPFHDNPTYLTPNSLVPPIYTANEFQHLPQQEGNFRWNLLERGRSDIDPTEDEQVIGYFYPKPRISFELPHFTPLSASSDVDIPNKDEAVITTTLSNDEITEETTTSLSTPKSELSAMA